MADSSRIDVIGRIAFMSYVRFAPLFRCALLTVVLCHVGCDERPRSERADQSQGFVAVVGVGQDDPVWHVLRASARRAYGELGLTSPALRTAAPKTSSVNAQKKLIETLRRQGMGTLCVQVTEPEALAGMLDSLARQGVRVVTMVRPAARDVVVFHAGIDEVAMGTMLADAIAEAVDFDNATSCCGGAVTVIAHPLTVGLTGDPWLELLGDLARSRRGSPLTSASA